MGFDRLKTVADESKRKTGAVRPPRPKKETVDIVLWVTIIFLDAASLERCEEQPLISEGYPPIHYETVGGKEARQEMSEVALVYPYVYRSAPMPCSSIPSA